MSEMRIDPFDERRKSLEEAFFKERDQQLLAKLRGEMAAFEERQKIAHASGIVDEKVLMDLVKAGVGAESLLAMRVVPMVEVAWCDGSVESAERAAVLNAAASLGIHPGSAAHDVLDRWLQERPDDRVVTAWKEYVKALTKLLPTDTASDIRNHMVDRCTRVATAAGGFLGLTTISQHERAKINEFASAWDG